MQCCGAKAQSDSAKLKRTETAIEDYRREIDKNKPENYGFASMAAVPYAHIVAKLLNGKHPKGTEIVLAPNPKDIVSVYLQFLSVDNITNLQIWENMNKSDGELARKRMVGFWLLALVCFFNTVPLFVISVLANLDSVSANTHTYLHSVLIPTIAQSICSILGRVVK